jgi:zinc protease
VSDLVTHLSNGLQVILREVHSAPVISFWVIYRVGSRNERTGTTGVSHWVEHMMFKGTERFPAGVLDREIDRAGGQWNAFTSMDYTMYYETLPADRIDLALEAEADRMVNAIFDIEETESERTVIISERQGSENSPLFWLNEEVRAAAFRVHGYHHDILGDMADLHTIQRDDLYAHYRANYNPANAIIVSVGAFQAQEMLAKIEQYFGKIAAAPLPKPFVRAEPDQLGERRVTVELPGSTSFITVAHRVPGAMHPDWIKLEVLDSVLTGAGGGVDNKTSRLYRALVKSGIAANIDGGMSETIDPYIYSITVTINDGHTHEDAETIVLEEIERIRLEGISAKELEKAKKQARASFAYGTESVTNQAYWIAQSALLGDLEWYNGYLEQLAAITEADVLEVAERYLTPRNRVIGWLLPVDVDMEFDDEELEYDEDFPA